MNSGESAAMWRDYGLRGKGIAIRSSISSLITVLQGNDLPLYLSTVAYIDYDTALIREDDGIYQFIHKRRSFQFENEIRILYEDPKAGDWPNIGVQTKPGTNVPVLASALIEDVRVGPATPDELVDQVNELLRTHEVPVTARRSDVNATSLI